MVVGNCRWARNAKNTLAGRYPGTPWDDGWHTVKIERRVSTGEIKVYFDDLTKPAMVASDKTFTSGPIGLGSFDDIGNFTDLKIWGVKAAN